jgi:hypothetical protein
LKKPFLPGLVCLAVAVVLGCQRSAPESSKGVRRLRFSGYEWVVKSGDRRVGPGPNYFSDSGENVEVDAEGRLHLRVTRRDGRWLCAEVVSAQSFGYGTYRFYLDGAVDDLDPQLVLGMFTWNDDPAYHHREIDIEISRWGRADNENGQFVVQPYTRRGNVERFQVPAGVQSSTHSFTWTPESVHSRSLKGHNPAASEPGAIIHQHTFTQDIPRAGGENARINLWLFGGRPSADGKEAEVIISRFEFVRP